MANEIHPDDLALVNQLKNESGKTSPVKTENVDAPAQAKLSDSASSTDSGPTKEQIARFKQGKFKMAERKAYNAWRKAGKPDFQEPKPVDAPVQGPAPKPPVETVGSPEPAPLEPVSGPTTIDEIPTDIPVATTGTVVNTRETPSAVETPPIQGITPVEPGKPTTGTIDITPYTPTVSTVSTVTGDQEVIKTGGTSIEIGPVTLPDPPKVDEVETEETITLENGNQVVDGIEYSPEGVEIGPHVEGKVQTIEEGPKPVEPAKPVGREAQIEEIKNNYSQPDVVEFNRKTAEKKDKLAEDFILNSEVMKGFKEDFQLMAGQRIKAEAERILAKNPNISEEDFNVKLTEFQTKAWGDAVASSSVISKLMADAQAYANSETEEEVKAFYDGKQLEYKMQGLEDLNMFQQMAIGMGYNPYNKKDSSILFQIGTAWDKYITEGIVGSFKEHNQLDYIKTKRNIIKSYDNLYKNGNLSKEKYESLKETMELEIEQHQVQHYEEMMENLNDEKINAALDQVIQDSDDENFFTTKNVILNIADQLPNLVPGLFASNPVGAAVALVLYAQQLNDEYADKSFRAMAATKYGISPEEVTPEMMNEIATSPEGLEELTNVRQAGAIGAAPTVVLSRLQLSGGKLAKVLGNPKALQLVNKGIAKITGTRAFNLIKRPLGIATTLVGETVEELGQETIGDFLADRHLYPGKSTGELLGDAVTRVAPWNWTKAYKDLALTTLISAGGTTAGTAALGGAYNAVSGKIETAGLLKIADLTSEEFQAKADIEKAALNKTLSNPDLDPESREYRAATEQYQKLLDTEEAFNEVKQYPHIRGNNKAETFKLLRERNSLKRTVKALEGSGLATQQKERMKAIDEKLDFIQKRSREGETGTVFDDLRRVVRGQQSVGAQRKANLPTKIVGKIENLWNEGFSLDKITNIIAGDKSLSGISAKALAAEVENAISIAQNENVDEGKRAFHKKQQQEIVDNTRSTTTKSGFGDSTGEIDPNAVYAPLDPSKFSVSSLKVKAPPGTDARASVLKLVDQVENLWRGSDGPGNITQLARAVEHFRPEGLSNKEWNVQIAGLVAKIQSTGRGLDQGYSEAIKDARTKDAEERAAFAAQEAKRQAKQAKETKELKGNLKELQSKGILKRATSQMIETAKVEGRGNKGKKKAKSGGFEVEYDVATAVDFGILLADNAGLITPFNRLSYEKALTDYLISQGAANQQLESKTVAHTPITRKVSEAKQEEHEAPSSVKDIGPRVQKQIEKRFHDQGLTVPDDIVARFSNPYTKPKAEVKQTTALSATNTNDYRQAIQDEITQRLVQAETARQTEKLLASDLEGKTRSNVAQSIRNEGYKPKRVTGTKKQLESELNTINTKFNENTAHKVANIKRKIENFLTQIEIVNDAVLAELPSGVWEQLVEDVDALAEAVTNKVGTAEQISINSKQLHDRETKLKKLYDLALKTYEAKVYNKGVETGVFPPGFNIENKGFDFRFKPEDYTKAYDTYFGTQEAYEKLTVKEWYNFQRDLALIQDYKDQLVDTSGLDKRKQKSIEQQIEKRTKKLKEATQKLSSKLSTREVAKNIVENIDGAIPTETEAANLKKMGDILGKDIENITDGRLKAVDKEKPTQALKMLYDDKKTQLETDLIYNALVFTNKELTDADLEKLFRGGGYVAYTQAESGLAGLGMSQSNRDDIRLMIEEYIELFGEDNLALLYDQAKEIKYMQDIGQRAAHGSPIAQATLIQSINPWLNKLVNKVAAEGIFRGVTSGQQKAEGLDSIDLGIPEKEQLKAAAVDGAIRALQTWDPAKGKFITYATRAAEGEMISFIKRWNGGYENGKNSTIAYEENKIETMQYIEAQAKLEIARYLYLKNVTPQLAGEFVQQLEARNEGIAAGISEMSGLEISQDPREIPKLSPKATAILDAVQNDPRQRKIANSTAEISRLKRLATIKPGVEISGLISQHESNIRLLSDPNINPADVPAVVVPESVINTRGGYLATGADLALEQYNNLKALPAPSTQQTDEINILEQQLLVEAAAVADELNGSIDLEAFEQAVAFLNPLTTEIKRLDAQLQEAAESNKAILLGRDPSRALTPRQQEQIDQNRALLNAVSTVKKQMVEQRKKIQLTQLAAKEGLIEVIGQDGPITEEQTAAIVPVQKAGEISTVLTPNLPSVSEVAKVALVETDSVGTGALEVVSDKQLALNENFEEIEKASIAIYEAGMRKRKEADKIGEDIGEALGDDSIYSQDHTTATVDENGNVYYDAETEARLKEDPYALSGTTVFTSGLSGNLEDDIDTLQAIGENTGGFSQDLGDKYLATQEAEKLEEIGSNLILINGLKKTVAHNPADQATLVQLVEDTKELISDHNQFLGIKTTTAQDEALQAELVKAEMMMDNTVETLKLAEVKVDPTLGLKEGFTPNLDALEDTKENLEKAIPPKNNVQKMSLIAPALFGLGVALGPENIDAIVNGFTALIDAIQYIAEIVFGFEGMETLSLASAIPFGYAGKSVEEQRLLRTAHSAINTERDALKIITRRYKNASREERIEMRPELIEARTKVADVFIKHNIEPTTKHEALWVSKRRSNPNAPISKAGSAAIKKPSPQDQYREAKRKVLKGISLSHHVEQRIQERAGESFSTLTNDLIDEIQIVSPGKNVDGDTAYAKAVNRLLRAKERNPKYQGITYVFIPSINGLIALGQNRRGLQGITFLNANGAYGDVNSKGQERDYHGNIVPTFKEHGLSQRLKIQKNILKTALSTFFTKGINKKEQVLKYMFKSFHSVNSVFETYDDFRDAMEKITGIPFRRGQLITAMELNKIKAAVEYTNQKLVNPGPVYQGQNAATTQALEWAFDKVDQETDYTSESEYGNPMSDNSTSRKTGWYAVTGAPTGDVNRHGTVDSARKYTYTNLAGDKVTAYTGVGAGYASAAGLETTYAAFKQGFISKRDMIRFTKHIWTSIGAAGNTATARQALKQNLKDVSYQEWYDASTPSEQKKMDWIIRAADKNGGKIPVYRGISLIAGLSEDQHVGLSTSVSFTEAHSFAVDDRTSSSVGNDRILMALIDPREHFFMGFKSAKIQEQEMVLNPNKPFPQFSSTKAPMNLDKAMDDESNTKTCM